MRTFGVEEELLLVNARDYSPAPAAPKLLSRAPRAATGRQATAEMQQEMIEVIIPPATDAAVLRADIQAARSAMDEAARASGARAVALATSPLPVHPHPTEKPRYRRMMRRYGITARNNLACGLHVHVSIDSPDEGVGVLDRIRVWLPTLIALSANPPYADGEDTGYASYRTMIWNQWPCAGPSPVFDTLEAYRDHERSLLSTGVLMDEGMLYFDARLSRAHPTVEVRVADVCARVETTVALAAIVRALVETAAIEWRNGQPAPDVSVSELRLDSWCAALSGLSDRLVHPVSRKAERASVVVRALLEHVRPALVASGDESLVDAEIRDLLTRGTAADRLRSVLLRKGTLEAVVAQAIDWTHSSGRKSDEATAPACEDPVA
ncbi:carboxylate-amine ligase [Rathayibacter sp. KR2-224]|uniref:carboxylate-amine ligase n=1 Tax=Rathayibacter sp. KR2-224 TaxID=3400913 RepID=UPI003C10014C